MSEARNPGSTVSVVASVCIATGPASLTVSVQIAEGAGTRYAGTANTRHPNSHSTTKITSAPSGCAMSDTQRARHRLRRAGMAGAEDERADAAGGVLGFMSRLHVEVARPGPPHLHEPRDCAGPRRHPHPPVGPH